MRGDRERSALDLLEEALHALRRAPGLLAPYYLGTLPFVLGFLHFWADMSRSAFAPGRCAAASLGLALLFVWMKAWHAEFAGGVRALRLGEPAPGWTPGRALRVAAAQAPLHAVGLVALPAAAVLTLPFGWVYAFLQHVTAVGWEPSGGLRATARRAWAQAGRDPGPNHALLALLGLVGLFAFLNLAVALVALPALLKMLLGLESPFTRSVGGFANTTLLAAVASLTYLAVDPLAKAAYALRHFYGESLATGEDLRADLRRLGGRPAAPTARTLALLLALAAGGLALEAAPARGQAGPAGAASSPGLEAGDLDRAVDRVLTRDEYAWRLPRERVDAQDEEPGILAAFWAEVGRILGQGLDAVGGVVQAALRWLLGLLPDRGAEPAGPRLARYGWVKPLLVAGLALALGVLLALALRRRRRRQEEKAPEPARAAPDLEDEAVAADQLPPEGWAALARDLLQQGQARLAVRALYLAGLAHLAEQRLVAVARYKSDREYEVELRRRGAEAAGLLPAFSQNLLLFERVWYGAHAPSAELWEAFAANHARIVAHGR